MQLARALRVAAIGLGILAALPVTASAQLPTTNDPRVGLAPGFENPGVAANGIRHLANRPKPPGFSDPANPGNFGFLTSDMAFQGDYAFVGNFNGYNIYNIANPSSPSLTTSVICPGGQGDVSVYQNLLFMSVEETRARIDCGTQGVPAGQEAQRFRGVRIFDISNISAPVQVAAVQTCRGSHTHTLVTDKSDRRNVYIYVQGTAAVRPATELAGCDGNNTNTPTGPNPSKWRIEVIKVPVSAPQSAAIVSEPRLFANAAGAVNGLQNEPPTPLHPCASATPPCGPGTGATGGAPRSPVPITDACHDITVYPEIELAAGACEGNGLLIDISDPANPRRIDAVADPNYAYWHGATFSNDGKTVVFTDEWGGGVQPRCRATDDLKWGGDSIYDIVNGRLVFRSYYKLPVAQTLQENCVSHIPSLIPVPGRDIMVQAFYQGGATLVDFSDSSNPREIGYWDRGPVSGTSLVFGGFWSTYWYNGETYGSELARNFDVLGLTPTAQLSANEIAAAREVQLRRLNVQRQDRYRWKPSFAVVRSFLDQLVRADDIDAWTLRRVEAAIDLAERFADRGKYRPAEALLNNAERRLRGRQYEDLRDALDDLADSFDRKRHHGRGHGRWGR
jgi:hypothetical protein